MTLPVIGDLLVINSTLAAAAAAVCYVLAWRGNERLLKPARVLFALAATFITGACAVLMTLILTHDFNVAYVASYSSTDLPIYFLISTFWGGQEGTFLLWLFYIAIMGLVVMKTAGGRYENGVMFYLGLILVSILVILLKKSPFETLDFTPVEGNGLNPLLQNYWMVIHPPTMFIGFAATAIPFAFAVTALTQRSWNDWAEKSRRWTLFAWLALGVALVEGGYWAYETLGWGGFWAWDPVENSSFIPWIFLATQIHSTFIRKNRNGMHRFGLFMVCLTFLSVLYGTFLTRSGVLADFSVHSFVDLGINNFLIGGMAFFAVLTFGLFAIRWNEIKSESAFASVFSRSYLVTLGVVVLFLGGVLTLLGTSAPLLTRFTENPSAVDIDYYKITMNPIAIAVLALLAIFPTFKWESGLQKKLVLFISLGLFVVTYIVLLLTVSIPSHMYLLILSLGVAALWSNGYFLVTRSKGSYIAAPYMVHVGLALLLMGATTSAGLEYGQKATLPMGKPVQVMGYNMTFTHVERIGNEEFQHIQMTTIDGDETFMASTESRTQERDGGVMRIPYVRHYLSHDFYIAPLTVQEEETEQPGLIRFEKGETKDVGPYQVTFDGFDVGGHGATATPNRAGAKLIVARDGKSSNSQPAIEIHGQELHPVSATFGMGADTGTVFIANIDAESGAVLLQFFGAFMPAPAAIPQTFLVAELTVKPLINLFWLGCVIVFVGGGFAFAQGLAKRRAAKAERLVRTAVSVEKQEVA